MNILLKIGRCVAILGALAGPAAGGAHPGPGSAFPAETPSQEVGAAKQNPGPMVDDIFKAWNTSDTPGAAIAVIQGGEVLLKRCYGTAVLEHGIPITPETSFNIGSVSKQFTALAILMLVEQGALALDTDARELLPEIASIETPILVSDLLYHTSGLRDWVTLLELVGWRLDDTFMMRDILGFAADQRELDFPPGTDFSYSNTGYTLLAEIVSRVTGTAFPGWMAENVFTPLGMQDTFVAGDYGKVAPNRASSYYVEAGEYRYYASSSSVYGGSGVYSTLEDMIVWMNNLSSGEVGGRAVIDALNKPGLLRNGNALGYGGGQFIAEHRGLPYIHHSGSAAGYVSWVGRFPEQELAIIVLSNNYEVLPPSRHGRRIADLFLPESPPPPAAPTGGEAGAATDKLEDYAGRYLLNSGDVLTIAIRGETLAAKINLQRRKIMRATGEDTFRDPQTEREISFVRAPREGEEGGAVVEVAIDGAEGHTIGRRLTGDEPKPDGPGPFTGAYYSPQARARFVISATAEGQLVLIHHRRGMVLLNHVAGDLYTGNGYLSVKFQRNADGKVGGFEYGGGRMRGVGFERETPRAAPEASPPPALRAHAPEDPAEKPGVISYEITLKSDVGGDTFLVRVEPPSLSKEDNVYHFVSTAPGVYSPLDFGRLVTSFEAIDGEGGRIPTERLSTNRWRIEDVTRLHHLQYEIAESFGSAVSPPIAYLAGTEIDSNHAFINTFGVLGYFDHSSDTPVRLKLKYPSDWTVGTVLELNQDGSFRADSFEQLADSPLMLGELDRASIEISGMMIDVFVFSSHGKITADDVLSRLGPALHAVSEFIGDAPVQRYAFLFEFLDKETRTRNRIRGIGALEHHASSGYILGENPRILSILGEWVAHEFFHIAIPLNLHSSNISPFDFGRANPDQHLWLYEGATVWASEIMFLRAGQTSLEDYLEMVAAKIQHAGQVVANKSLAQASRDVYGESGESDTEYIDNNGSLAVLCLDILMLELSGGTRGFREVLIDLMRTYGEHRPFPDDALFSIIEDVTGPEVGRFLKRYVQGNEPLPYADYLRRIGLAYIADGENPRVVVDSDASDGQRSLRDQWMR